jgi:hypothetical protein
MALSDLQWLRLKIADRPRLLLHDPLGVGDGANTLFKLRVAPIVADSETVTVNGVEQTQDTDYTIDNSLGLITFTAAPAADAEVVATFQFVAFTDTELTDLLTAEGSRQRAAMEAVRWLLADQDRFLKYTFGQETVDRSGARDALQFLLEELKSSQPAPIGLVWADTDEREDIMFPYIEQDEELVDVA